MYKKPTTTTLLNLDSVREHVDRLKRKGKESAAGRLEEALETLLDEMIFTNFNYNFPNYMTFGMPKDQYPQ